MSCSVCSAPAAADLCPSCAAMVTTVAPATLSVQRDASRKRFWMDKAREGDERARQRCIRKGWIVEEVEVDKHLMFLEQLGAADQVAAHLVVVIQTEQVVMV